MTWLLPGALAGLLLLPVLWWWHRRRARPVPRDHPSFLFLEGLLADVPPVRRALDRDLLLGLLAVALLVLAAAGPAWRVRAPGRRIAVIVSGGAPAGARGQPERVAAALEALREAIGPQDDLLVRQVPPGDDGPRPPAARLIDAALAEPAAWRVVLSDHAGPPTPPGVTWQAVGGATTRNAGLVAAAIVPAADGDRLAVTVGGDAGAARRVRLLDEAGRALATAAVPPPGDAGLAAAMLPLSAEGGALEVRLEVEGRDDLPADDAVALARRPLRVFVDRALPDDLVALLDAGLDAVLGPTGHGRATEDDADLQVVAAGAGGPPSSAGGPPWRLLLHPVAEVGAAVVAPAGPTGSRPHPLVDDLGLAGVDLVFAPDALETGAAAEALLWREAAGRRWPVVLRDGRDVHWLPDPRRGRPSPGATPLWPLFVDDLARVVGGTASAGWRVRGLLDLASTRLGRADDDLDVAQALAGRPADRPPVLRDLRRPLLLLALLVLLVLWWPVRLRRGVTAPRRRRGRTAVGSAP